MQLFHNFHNNQIYKFFHSDLWLFELSVWLHTFSRALIAIFIPILLLKIGYSIGEVIFYYFIFNLFDVPLNFFAQKLTVRLGAKRVIILGSFFSIGYFAILFNLIPNNWFLLTALAFCAAMYDTLYWISHLFIFYQYNRKKSVNTSRNTSMLYILRTLAGITAPIIGAMILIYLDKKILILISISILTISLWPLFKIKKIKDIPRVKKLSIKKFFSDKEILKKYLSRGLCSFSTSADSIIWPIFVFLIFDSIKSVAYLSLIASLTTIILTFLTSKLTDANKKITIMASGIALSVVWILRIFIEGQMFYYVSAFLIGLFSVLIHIPIDISIAKLSRKKDALSVSTYRNLFDMTSNLIFYGALSLLVNIFDVSFMIASTSTLAIVALISTINSKFL